MNVIRSRRLSEEAGITTLPHERCGLVVAASKEIDMSAFRLYELDNADGNCTSPFVWRIRFALQHKGLEYESVRVGFLDIPRIGPGTLKTVPVIEHDGGFFNESWKIAEWLDVGFPETISLFGSPAEYSMAQFFDKWFGTAVLPPLFRSCVYDLFQRVKPHEQQYFRSTREKMFGESLESVAARGHEYLRIARKALLPMRLALRRAPFLGGTHPGYADFIAWGTLAAFSPITRAPLLAPDDSLNRWVDCGRSILQF
jgi:glutathione S-transferase